MTDRTAAVRFPVTVITHIQNDSEAVPYPGVKVTGA